MFSQEMFFEVGTHGSITN
jgi:hypothetical protein